MLHQIASNRWFALAELLMVFLSGLLWLMKPEIGILPVIAIALIPRVVRWAPGSAPLRNTLLNWLAAIILITAWVGYWAAYDSAAAWSKVWFIVLAVLFYYGLASQPQENLEWVCALFFCIGVGVSIYFLLTQDFVALPRRIEVVNRLGRWLMEGRPGVGWMPIHPNYAAGVAAITIPFAVYPAVKLLKQKDIVSGSLLALITLGLGITSVAILMATSRGIILAIASALGIWLVWRVVGLNGSRLRLSREAVFPVLVLIYLGAVILFIYAGPANSSGVVSEGYFYGTGSRGELFARSLYLLADFPFTGSGLAAFPGMYSFYILGIPNFNVANSHNLFLDVAIEQGLLGGAAFLAVFLMSIWFTARTIAKTSSSHTRMLSWLLLSALMIAFIHGMVDDYLYNGSGAFLMLSLAGLSALLQPEMTRTIHLKNYRAFGILALVLLGFFLFSLNDLRSAWNANLGALQMAKVELDGFPTNQWSDPSILPRLNEAESTLHSALEADPTNRTANHRLGLIALLKNDFHSAAAFLAHANREAPGHRGVIKSLGYCYTWLGNMDKAIPLLRQIPEAKAELDIYVWWWGVYDQPDLAQKASFLSSKLESITNQE